MINEGFKRGGIPDKNVNLSIIFDIPQRTWVGFFKFDGKLLVLVNHSLKDTNL